MYKWIFFLFASFSAAAVSGQPVIDSIRFFEEEGLIEMTLETDLRELMKVSTKENTQPAAIRMRFPDSTLADGTITVSARGNFRRSYCKIPPLSLQFRNSSAPQLRSLGKLKMVLGCTATSSGEELLLKEYLIYKIYNILEDRSFRVRLLHVTYKDTKDRLKEYSQYAFLIEDDAEMARRNGCKKKDKPEKRLTETTNREMMTKVALFQYMIGNTDWAVPNNHNIRLIYDRKDKNALPFVVPYDFDYCGLVNASYATPHESVGAEKVTDRVYRGFPRSMEELQQTLELFRNRKKAILDRISFFERLPARARKEMTTYLDEFFKLIENPNKVRSIFIENARSV